MRFEAEHLHSSVVQFCVFLNEMPAYRRRDAASIAPGLPDVPETASLECNNDIDEDSLLAPLASEPFRLRIIAKNAL